MQQAGQVAYLDQNDAHEQSLGQSDGSLPGPEQTRNQNQSINQLQPNLRLDRIPAIQLKCSSLNGEVSICESEGPGSHASHNASELDGWGE